MLRTRTLTAVGAVTLALALPAGAAAQQDLRSPDVRDGAASALGQDLRSPDTRDAATVIGQDLRSPDARDAALRVQPTALDIRPSEPPPAVTTPAVADGFEWGSAGIGAAAMLALILGLAGLTAVLAPRAGRHLRFTH